MTKDLSPKKEALAKLLALAKDRSFDTYETTGDIYGERAWPLNWSEHLWGIQKRTAEEKQNRLNETLFRLSRGDLPDTMKQLNKEKLAIHLVLKAGANPNATHGREGNTFQSFMDNQKRYGALEIAKSADFHYVENSDSVFQALRRVLTFYLKNGHPYPLGTDEEVALNRQTTADDKELVSVLFQKGIYPRREDLFNELAPIVQEKTPLFFEQEQKRVITSLQKVKTPHQFWAVMTGQQKEKE